MAAVSTRAGPFAQSQRGAQRRRTRDGKLIGSQASNSVLNESLIVIPLGIEMMNTLLLAVIVIVILGVAVFLVLTKGNTGSTVADIRRQIARAISRRKESPTTEGAAHASRIEEMERLRANTGPRSAPKAPKGQHRKTVTLASEVPKATAPDCPKCGAPMVLQKSKLGGGAGQEFWGCSTFPKCRGIAKFNA
ncbi:MAG: topoisomerase DNA-binding C4 zinc finger domain-containing protein [Nitrococcus mobilis]|nr:topoisomerase DNA-binding C4 zinc finger domain-containing protein [Nitrococcus mobilis]